MSLPKLCRSQALTDTNSPASYSQIIGTTNTCLFFTNGPYKSAWLKVNGGPWYSGDGGVSTNIGTAYTPAQLPDGYAQYWADPSQPPTRLGISAVSGVVTVNVWTSRR